MKLPQGSGVTTTRKAQKSIRAVIGRKVLNKDLGSN